MAGEFGLAEVGWFTSVFRKHHHHERRLGEQDLPGDCAAKDVPPTSGGGADDRPRVEETTAQAGGNSAGAHKKIVLACATSNGMLMWGASCLLIPFFSSETFEKFPGGGLKKQLTIGCIYGIYGIVSFSTGPLAAKEIPKAGSKLVLVLSTFLIAAMLLLFSFVNRINGWTEYVAICMAIRLVQGVGGGANIVSCTSILVGVFPDQSATAIGVYRTSIALGYALGTFSGGVLYHHGGFPLPFYVGGGVMLLNMLCQILLLPQREEQLSNVALEKNISFKALLSVPWVWAEVITLFLAGTLLGYVEPPLPVYFKKAFGASSVLVGIAMLLQGTFYGVACPVTGYSIDRWNINPRLVNMLGVMLGGVSCLLLGPAKFLPIPKSLALSYVCMVGLGLSLAFVFISSMPNLLETYREQGYSNPTTLRAPVSSIYQAPISIGYALGPILGSGMTALLGFPNACGALGIAFLVWAAFVSAAILCLCPRQKSVALACVPNSHHYKKLSSVEPLVE